MPDTQNDLCALHFYVHKQRGVEQSDLEGRSMPFSNHASLPRVVHILQIPFSFQLRKAFISWLELRINDALKNCFCCSKISLLPSVFEFWGYRPLSSVTLFKSLVRCNKKLSSTKLSKLLKSGIKKWVCSESFLKVTINGCVFKNIKNLQSYVKYFK